MIFTWYDYHQSIFPQKHIFFTESKCINYRCKRFISLSSARFCRFVYVIYRGCLSCMLLPITICFLLVLWKMIVDISIKTAFRNVYKIISINQRTVSSCLLHFVENELVLFPIHCLNYAFLLLNALATSDTTLQCFCKQLRIPDCCQKVPLSRYFSQKKLNSNF